MRSRAFAVVAATVLLTVAAASRASAQSDRIRINVDAGGQFSTVKFDTSATKTVYIESAVIGGSYELSRGLALDGGISVRLFGGLGVGVTVSSFTEKADAAVTAAIPHPFFFRTPRTITGTANSLQRSELVTHIQGVYTLHPNRKMDVTVSAGPSIFHVEQDVVTDVAFGDVYPYDAPTFTSAASQKVTAKNKTGFNAGVDVDARLSRHAGVGGGVRFSKATVSLTMPNSTTTVSMDAGGTQVVGGLRLFF